MIRAQQGSPGKQGPQLALSMQRVHSSWAGLQICVRFVRMLWVRARVCVIACLRACLIVPCLCVCVHVCRDRGRLSFRAAVP